MRKGKGWPIIGPTWKEEEGTNNRTNIRRGRLISRTIQEKGRKWPIGRITQEKMNKQHVE